MDTDNILKLSIREICEQFGVSEVMLHLQTKQNQNLKQPEPKLEYKES